MCKRRERRGGQEQLGNDRIKQTQACIHVLIFEHTKNEERGRKQQHKEYQYIQNSSKRKTSMSDIAMPKQFLLQSQAEFFHLIHGCDI